MNASKLLKSASKLFASKCKVTSKLYRSNKACHEHLLKEIRAMEF